MSKLNVAGQVFEVSVCKVRMEACISQGAKAIIADIGFGCALRVRAQDAQVFGAEVLAAAERKVRRSFRR